MLFSTGGQKSLPNTLQPMSSLTSQNTREKIVNNPFLNHPSLPRTINESVKHSITHMDTNSNYHELRMPRNKKSRSSKRPNKLNNNLMSHETQKHPNTCINNTDRTQIHNNNWVDKISEISMDAKGEVSLQQQNNHDEANI